MFLNYGSRYAFRKTAFKSMPGNIRHSCLFFLAKVRGRLSTILISSPAWVASCAKVIDEKAYQAMQRGDDLLGLDVHFNR